MPRPLGALLVALGLALAAAAGAAEAEEHYTTGDDSRRPWVEVLSWKPRAYLYHNFLTHEECDHIIKASIRGQQGAAGSLHGAAAARQPLRTEAGL